MADHLRKQILAALETHLRDASLPWGVKAYFGRLSPLEESEFPCVLVDWVREPMKDSEFGVVRRELKLNIKAFGKLDVTDVKDPGIDDVLIDLESALDARLRAAHPTQAASPLAALANDLTIDEVRPGRFASGETLFEGIEVQATIAYRTQWGDPTTAP